MISSFVQHPFEDRRSSSSARSPLISVPLVAIVGKKLQLSRAPSTGFLPTGWSSTRASSRSTVKLINVPRRTRRSRCAAASCNGFTISGRSIWRRWRPVRRQALILIAVLGLTRRLRRRIATANPEASIARSRRRTNRLLEPVKGSAMAETSSTSSSSAPAPAAISLPSARRSSASRRRSSSAIISAASASTGAAFRPRRCCARRKSTTTCSTPRITG